MKFAYFPGCSLEYTARPYDQSVREVFKALQIPLEEIDDWNCCGATMYMSQDNLVAYSVSARNLAIAQKMGCDAVCAPCSSCYTILRKTNRYVQWDPQARAMINEALGSADLSYTEVLDVRHPLDILVNDVGLDRIVDRATKSLSGFRIAPYYGCQIVRPVYHFDDMDNPTTMDRLFTALGAEVIGDYPGKVRCCGGMLMMTFEDVALDLNHSLLQGAEERGANVMATVCPMCQMNLESYQPRINETRQANHHLPVVYFTQLLGLALGIEPAKLGLDSLIVRLPELKAGQLVSEATYE
ncbi:CoB--CoM heterodisulfide reductase iron-sulfur subunit B family protein [candidate division KSB1 bacterium]|nr:CoB--CoM heterodisulfide reductase iron-sulfur subunit B family protein [candidate division KSB1 bacterium]